MVLFHLRGRQTVATWADGFLPAREELGGLYRTAFSKTYSEDIIKLRLAKRPYEHLWMDLLRNAYQPPEHPAHPNLPDSFYLSYPGSISIVPALSPLQLELQTATSPMYGQLIFLYYAAEPLRERRRIQKALGATRFRVRPRKNYGDPGAFRTSVEALLRDIIQGYETPALKAADRLRLLGFNCDLIV